MEQKMIGPKTTRKEFYGQCIDLDYPAFKGLREALEKDDIALCDKIFADAIRGSEIRELHVKSRKTHLDGLSEQGIKNIYAAARELMNYTVCSCGVKHTFTDRHIDWTFNPTYNNYAEWPWQFNRHDIGPLVNYFALTGDKEAVDFYSDYFCSWIEQAIAPPIGAPGHNVGPGVEKWTWRTIEAGLRMQGWPGHAYYMAPYLTDKLVADMFISIYEHGVRLSHDYTTFNWLIMEMHGLLNICVNCPFFKDSEKWYDSAIQILIDQLDIQLYPDGFQCELTTNYHFVVDVNYMHVIALLEKFGRKAPEKLLVALEKAFDIYYKLMRPDGKLPDLNDGKEYDVAWRLGLIKKYYPENETYRYFYTKGAEGKAPEQLSYPFDWSGAMIMRTGWGEKDFWSYMDCSPFGLCHQHEDKCNVLVYAYGKNMLIEGGCYDYDASAMRSYVVHSRSHNTVMLNGKEQNRYATYRRENLDINAKADITYKLTEDFESASTTYDEGYGADLEKMTHNRRLIFIKNAEKYGLKPFYIVVDRFTAEDDNARKYEQMWHTEALEYSQDKAIVQCDFGDGVGMTLASSDGEFVNMRGQYEPYYQGWFKILPCGPHEHRPIHTPVLVGEFEGKKRVVTVLYPYENENNFVSVSADTDYDATDITIVTGDGKFTLDEKDFI